MLRLVAGNTVHYISDSSTTERGNKNLIVDLKIVGFSLLLYTTALLTQLNEIPLVLLYQLLGKHVTRSFLTGTRGVICEIT